ncbi:MAG TPA: GtrA family protein [Acidimicrobiales bacterium]|nr:GtrA family protein [Acidimicrobiales bacterium]
MGLLRTPIGVKLFRYSMASVVAVITSTVLFVIFDGAIRFSAVVAATLATAIAAIPSYELNRKWAWGKSGRSHLLKEVIPFWTLAFIGWAFSTFSVRLMEDYSKSHQFSHLLQTAAVTLVYIGAFGVLWVGKFIIFNKFMFVHHHHDGSQELDGAPGARA